MARGSRGCLWTTAAAVQRVHAKLAPDPAQAHRSHSTEVEVPPRFLQLSDVAETLNVSARQAYALVNSGELAAIRVRGQWRIEASELEAYIQRQYAETRQAAQQRQEVPPA